MLILAHLTSFVVLLVGVLIQRYLDGELFPFKQASIGTSIYLSLFTSGNVFAGCAKVLLLSTRMTRHVQTIWAASFYDSSNLARKLLTFEKGAIPQTTQFPIVSAVIAVLLFASWLWFRASSLLISCLSMISLIPSLFLWSVILPDSDVIMKPNFAEWLESDPFYELVLRVGAILFFFVVPLLGIIWWFIAGDLRMIAPYVSILILFIIWLYLDVRWSFSAWLVQRRNRYWICVVFLLYGGFFLPLTNILYGVRYNEAVWQWVAAMIFSLSFGPLLLRELYRDWCDG
jgi:hypothetical protein